MSLKRLLALASGEEGDTVAFAFGAELARAHGAVALGLPVYSDSTAEMTALGVALGAPLTREVIDRLADAVRVFHDRIEAAARRAANEADVVFGPGEGAPRLWVLPRGLGPETGLSRHATLADLVVVAQAEAATRRGRGLLGQALLSDRVPVLVARGDPERLSSPAAIAWDGSAQAGRAVRAATPLLASAQRILVVQCATGLDRRQGDPDMEVLDHYLRLHGVRSGEAVLVEGEDEGAAIVAAARTHGAGLLVAGAWGRSRMQEFVFGGATRAFLADAEGPSLLLAH